MSRLTIFPLSALPLSACMAALAMNAFAGEPSFDYSLRAGHDTNLFEDTSKLSGAFIEAEAKLRGTLGEEGSQFSYGLWHREKFMPAYRFGNQYATGVSLGYKRKLADNVVFNIEGAVSREERGDVLIAVPGAVIGYRHTDLTYAMAASLAAAYWGGQNTFSASVNDLNRGKSTFTTDLLQRAKLHADVTALELTASHIRPAMSGELGFTVAYRSATIPNYDQTLLNRFPASTLRGSIAYGRKIADQLTIIAEFGATDVMADKLGSSVQRLRPFLHTSAVWTPRESLAFSVGYDRDYAITNIDDALGEYIGTWKFAAGVQLAPKLTARVNYDIASSEWLYYLYNTRTKRLTGTLAYEFAKNHKVELEYKRIDRGERDTSKNFVGDQYTARVSGTF